MVSWFALAASESIVAALLKSRELPQTEQNRPFEETCAPQAEQYMGTRILPSCAIAARYESNLTRERRSA